MVTVEKTEKLAEWGIPSCKWGKVVIPRNELLELLKVKKGLSVINVSTDENGNLVVIVSGDSLPDDCPVSYRGTPMQNNLRNVVFGAFDET